MFHKSCLWDHYHWYHSYGTKVSQSKPTLCTNLDHFTPTWPGYACVKYQLCFMDYVHSFTEACFSALSQYNRLNKWCHYSNDYLLCVFHPSELFVIFHPQIVLHIFRQGKSKAWNLQATSISTTIPRKSACKTKVVKPFGFLPLVWELL